MSERNKTILISFLLGFVASWLSSHLLEIAFANFFDDFSSGNVDLQDASDPSGVELMNALARNRAGEIPVVDFSILTSFSWDRLYMFGDYTQPSDLDAIVGRSWRENCYTNISTSEGALLVFTANRIVIHCINSYEDFLIPEQAYKNGIPSREALFITNDIGRIVWVGDTQTP